MHVHLPKPLHGWREFAGEVGIIVLGVLIALAAEQFVESLNDRSELHEAERAMASQLKDDDLPQAYTRAAMYHCYSLQLDAIENAIGSGDRATVESLAANYRPLYRTWDDQAWQAALSSNVLVHAGSNRMVDWGTAFTGIPLLQQMANHEQATLPQLRARMSGTGRLSAQQQDRLFGIVSTLREDNFRMTGLSVAEISLARSGGVVMSGHQQAKLLAEAAKVFGPCVAKPPQGPTDIHDTTAESSLKDH